jgi:hypothetical protein
MKTRFQFTLPRAILSTTLIALGMAGWPLARRVDRDGEWASELLAACLVAFLALPGAGIGLLFHRPIVGVIGGLAIGVLAFYLVRAISW